MRVLLSTYDSRGGVEPLVGLAVRLRELGAEPLVCAPPDEEFAERLADVGVPLVPFGRSVRAMATGATPPPAAGVPQRAAALIATQFDAVAAVAEGCDVLVATGLLPVAAGARSLAEKLGIRYVYASFQPVTLPSPHHPPHARPGLPLPPEVTDNRVLWDLDAQSANTLFGAALNTHRAEIGLPPVDDVRDYAFTDQPWLWAGRVADLGIGTAHDGPTPTTESLSAALRTTLTPETRVRATAVAGTIRTDGATVAATLLIDAITRCAQWPQATSDRS